MNMRYLIFSAVALCLAACGKEQGAGFTGIGASSSKAQVGHYALDFPGYSAGKDQPQN